jgi:outer membrane protein assembly factor BamB
MRQTRWLTGLLMLALPAAAVAEDWPLFRGPTGQGVSSETDVPLHWSATENVAWKVEVPGAGWSSPVVAGDRVYLTTATDGGAACRVLAFDRATGRAVWDKEVFRQTIGRLERKNSPASPTPAADGERVYAVFGDGSVACLDRDGAVVWTNRDFPHYSQHGLGASPVLYRELLVMPYDGSSSGPDKQVGWKKPWEEAKLVAFDKATGKVRWVGRRGPSRIAHVTPVVVAVDGRDQLLSSAGDVIQGFDPATGERLWSVYSKGEGVVPSPVWCDGLAVAASGFEAPTLRAVRPGGKGREPELAWELTRQVPTIPSGVYVKPHLFTVSDKGVAQCVGAVTGRVVWSERVGEAYSASPVAAAGRVYLLSEAGVTTVVEAGPAFRVLARNPVGERCQASLAISRGQVFLRGEKHLYCIGRSSSR